MRRSFWSAVALSMVALAFPQAGFAQAYPDKPIRVIVPATPGGTSDIFARAIARKLQDAMGQPVLVEYKPGAGTNIGSDYVAKSAPDGYTLLINGITLATNPSLYANMPFDPAKDLSPIIELAEMLNVVTVHPSVPATCRRSCWRSRPAPKSPTWPTRAMRRLRRTISAATCKWVLSIFRLRCSSSRAASCGHWR